MTSPLQILKKYWNYTQFREPQEAIINTVLAKKNVVALLPTGGGKSICFQIPALINDGICIVISPLIALMQDQVNNLMDKGIKAVAITSSLSQEEIINTFDNLQYGNYKFLYLSPEKLQSDFIQQKINQLQVNTIAVDEAHCISEWGHDFRPSYRNINVLKEIHPEATIIALTASATTNVLDDITENLGLKNVEIFRKSLNREHLAYRLLKTEDIYYAVKQKNSKSNSPTIIYTGNRKATKNLSNFLNFNNFKSSYYHGGLLHSEKQEAFANWMSEKTPIMVATNAFGMGIDKNNVSTIIHTNLPYSLENYMQEAGRAGRNGEKAVSTIIYNEATIFDFENIFDKGKTSIDFIKKAYANLNQYFQISIGEKSENLYDFNLQDFCKKYESPILKTFNAIQILDREEVIKLDESFSRKSTVQFIANHNEVLVYSARNKNVDKLIKLILRSHGGIFDSAQKVDEYILSKKLSSTSFAIIDLLHILRKDGIIDYNEATNNSQLKFLVPREDNYTINNIAKKVKQRNKIKLQKAQAVLAYIKNKTTCRSQFLLSYFGELNSDKCGICDVCLNSKKESKSKKPKDLANSILKLLKEHQQLSSREIVEHLTIEKNSALATLQLLLDKNKIAITSQNKFELTPND